MKANVMIEMVMGTICNVVVDIIKREGKRIIIKTWDGKFSEFELVNGSTGNYYEFIKYYDRLPGEFFS